MLVVSVRVTVRVVASSRGAFSSRLVAPRVSSRSSGGSIPSRSKSSWVSSLQPRAGKSSSATSPKVNGLQPAPSNALRLAAEAEGWWLNKLLPSSSPRAGVVPGADIMRVPTPMSEPSSGVADLISELPVPSVTHADLVAAEAASRVKIDAYIKELNPKQPLLVMDTDVVAANFSQLRCAMPSARIFYAVKSNPAPQVLTLLASLGCCFDTATVAEIKMALAAGASPQQISYGNTIKKSADIKTAYDLGVRLFAFDSEVEMHKLAKHAPGASVFCRILTSGKGAEWPLSRKFGCEPAMAEELLVAARDVGLNPIGVSFHVGSQQRDVTQWQSAIQSTAAIFRAVKAHGINLSLVNLGGGFPTKHLLDVPSAQDIGDAIHSYLHAEFGDSLPELIIEPGRGMVGNAGSLVTHVVMAAYKSETDTVRWVYLDCGKFGGLQETIDECIHYSIETGHPSTAPTGPVILAGPTCDSADVMYERKKYHLPLDLKEGDRLIFRSAGAYTTTLATNGFNGFAALEEHFI